MSQPGDRLSAEAGAIDTRRRTKSAPSESNAQRRRLVVMAERSGQSEAAMREKTRPIVYKGSFYVGRVRRRSAKTQMLWH